MDDNKEPTSSFVEAGTTGLQHTSGYVREEFHKDLIGQKAAKMYREMGSNDPIIAVSRHLLDLTARRTDYSVDTARDEDKNARKDAGAVAAQRHVDESFQDVEGGLEGLIGWGAAGVMQYGFAMCEPVYKFRQGENPSKLMRSKYNDGKIGFRKFGKRRQESIEKWGIDDTGEWFSAFQRAAPKYELRELDRERLLHFKLFDADGNPEGESMLRACYESYYHLRNHKFIEDVGAERNLAGLPIARGPLSLFDANDPAAVAALAKYTKIVRNLRTDNMNGLVYPAADDAEGKTGYDIGLMSASGRALVESDTIIRRYRAEIAMALHTQFILIAQDSVGAQSSIEGHMDMLAIAVEGMIDCILQVINEVAIPELLALNGMPRSDAPTISRGSTQRRDIAALAQFVGPLAAAGFLRADDTLEAALREAAQLPPVDTITERAPAEPTGADLNAILGETFGEDAAETGNGNTLNRFKVEADLADIPTPAEQVPTAENLDTAGVAVEASAALNGAQITSLVAVLNSVASGEMPRDSAIKIMTTAFPIDDATANEIMGSIGAGFVPKSQEVDPTPGPV